MYTPLMFRKIRLAIRNPRLFWRWLTTGGNRLSDVELYEMEKYFTNKGSIIEAGAADGIDTVRLASKFSFHHIHSLEPVVEQFERTCSLTLSYSNVTVYNEAFSLKSGVNEINIGNSGFGLSGMGSSSLLPPKDHLIEFPEINFGEKRKVRTITLKEFCEREGITYVDLLWLDIQGLELSVIMNDAIFVTQSVNLIYMEASKKELYSGSHHYKIIRQELNNLGFKIVIDRVGRVSGNILAKNTNTVHNFI